MIQDCEWANPLEWGPCEDVKCGIGRKVLVFQFLPCFITKDCSSNFRSKHSTVFLLCLLRKLLEQSLPISMPKIRWGVKIPENIIRYNLMIP